MSQKERKAVLAWKKDEQKGRVKHGWDIATVLWVIELASLFLVLCGNLMMLLGLLLILRSGCSL